MLHLLIFPTGQPLNYVDAYYYFNATALNSNQTDKGASTLVVVANEIFYTGPILGSIQLYSIDGEMIQQEMMQQPSVRMDLDGLAAGMYVLRLPSGACHKFTKLH